MSHLPHVTRILVACAVLVPCVANATCERDLQGLINSVDDDPTHSAYAEGARTTNDFQVATANYFFFSTTGSNYTDDHLSAPSLVTRIFSVLNGRPGPRQVHRVPICSDVGQCAQGAIYGDFESSELPGSSVSIGGEGIGASFRMRGGTEYVLTGYTVQADLADGSGAAQPYPLNEVETRQSGDDPLQYALPSAGTEEGAQEDDSCRDNEGNEIEEETTTTYNGGGGEDGYDGSGDGTSTSSGGGSYWECWDTSTGVACREIWIDDVLVP